MTTRWVGSSGKGHSPRRLTLSSKTARQVVERLAGQDIRCVLAESCTCGLIAARLGGVPGVSQWLVGSLVSYRLDAKQRWLGVPSKWLEPSGPGAVSQPVAEAMAEGALRCAPEAQVSLAITGHLGPGAPLQEDGMVWIAVARRGGRSGARMLGRMEVCWSGRFRLQSEAPRSLRDSRRRIGRQKEAAELALAVLEWWLEFSV
ncbi:MAG: CinA family protein [Pirellulaceae bacterium]